MNRILTSMVFLVLLFPSLTLGEEVTMDGLVEREGIYYKKYTDVPFIGKVTGKEQGSFKNGKKEGSWVSYWDNGQLRHKGDYKNGEREGPWVIYYDNGQLDVQGDLKGQLEQKEDLVPLRTPKNLRVK